MGKFGFHQPSLFLSLFLRLCSLRYTISGQQLFDRLYSGETVFDALTNEGLEPVSSTGEIDPKEQVKDVVAFEEGMKTSWVHEELYEVRNCHESFKWGLLPGLVYTGITAHITKGLEPWTLSHEGRDAAHN